MLSNAYFLAKFRFDTAENEPAKNLQKFANFAKFANIADPNPLKKVAEGQLKVVRTHRPQHVGAPRQQLRHVGGLKTAAFRIRQRCSEVACSHLLSGESCR